jgi:hypothetical protein
MIGYAAAEAAFPLRKLKFLEGTIFLFIYKF